MQLKQFHPRTQITDDMIGYVDIPQSAIKGNVLTNKDTQILGMYTNVNATNSIWKFIL